MNLDRLDLFGVTPRGLELRIAQRSVDDRFMMLAAVSEKGIERIDLVPPLKNKKETVAEWDDYLRWWGAELCVWERYCLGAIHGKDSPYTGVSLPRNLYVDAKDAAAFADGHKGSYVSIRCRVHDPRDYFVEGHVSVDSQSMRFDAIDASYGAWIGPSFDRGLVLDAMSMLHAEEAELLATS